MVEPLEVPVEVQVGLVYPGKAMLAELDLLLLQDRDVEVEAVLVPSVEVDRVRMEAMGAVVLLVQSLVHPFIMLVVAVLVLTRVEAPEVAVMGAAAMEVGLVQTQGAQEAQDQQTLVVAEAEHIL